MRGNSHVRFCSRAGEVTPSLRLTIGRDAIRRWGMWHQPCMNTWSPLYHVLSLEATSPRNQRHFNMPICQFGT
jgi:hypothetical protein